MSKSEYFQRAMLQVHCTRDKEGNQPESKGHTEGVVAIGFPAAAVAAAGGAFIHIIDGVLLSLQ